MGNQRFCLLILVAFTTFLVASGAYVPLPYKDTDITGNYVVSRIGSVRPIQTITVKLDNSSISIQGCNSLRSTYTYAVSTKSWKVNQFASTLRFCENDQDSLITQALSNARKVVKQGTTLIFQDAQGKETIRFDSDNGLSSTTSPVVPPVVSPVIVIPPVVSPSVPSGPNYGSSSGFNNFANIQGKYDLTLPSLELTIQQNAFSLRGCNTHNFQATFSQNNNVRFGSAASTRKACQIDFDNYYLQAFNYARYWVPVGKGYRAYDESNRYLLQVVANQNSYLVNFPSVDLTVEASSFRYEGCNILNSQYSLIDVSSIKFGPSVSTRRSCLFYDFDQYISKSLELANRYEFNSKYLSLRSGDSLMAVAFPKNAGFSQSQPFTIPPFTTPFVLPPPIWTPGYNQNNYITPPQVVLPGVSPISLSGVYRLESTDTNLGTIILTIDDDYIQFESCNLNRIPYAAFTDGIFTILQGGSSTLRECALNNDNAYINILRSINRYQKTDGGYVLLNNNNIIANLPNRVRNQIVRYNIINGGYQFDITGLDATVDDAKISFRGCNSVSIPFTIYKNNRVQFGNAISTRIFCERDVDPIYVKAITSAKVFQQTKDGFSLLNEKGLETIKFVGVVKREWKYGLDFNGKFKLQLPNAGIRLKISDGQFTLTGCNEYIFKFSLSDNGDIIFGAPSSTNQVCETDNDKVFLYALLKAQGIAVIDRVIVFLNSNKEQVAKATNFQMSKTYGESPVVIDGSSPVIKIVDYKLASGTYKFTLLRTSLKILTATVNGKTVSFKGCNSINFSYTASSDGKIKFNAGISTLMACVDDYDNFYKDALASVATFTESKGMYTFFNEKGQSVITFVADSSAPQVPVTAPLYNNYDYNSNNYNYNNNFNNYQSSVSSFIPNISGPLEQIIESIISLKGQYNFRLPQVGFEISDNSFIFRGCNVYRVPCTYKNSNIFFGNPVTTNRQCTSSSNFDDYFLKLIPQVNTFKFENNSFTFFNSRYQSIFSANLNSASNFKTDLAPGLHSGSYSAFIPSADVQFDNDNIFFRGCRDNSFGYSAKSSGLINFTNLGSKRSCYSTDDDDIFINAFRGATRYRKTDNGFILHDNDGNERGTCNFANNKW